jgi:hypothetical protein
MDREGSLDMIELWGGVLLSPENAQTYCLGGIGRGIVCLLQAGMYNVVKHYI